MLGRRLWLVFSLFVLYGATIPFDFDTSISAAGERLSELTLNPLVSPVTGKRVSLSDSVQNVLLFMPFGAMGMAAAGPKGRKGVGRLVAVTLLGTLLSAAAECIQLFLPARIPSVADIATNSVGALLGAALVLVVSPLVADALRRLMWADAANAFTFYPVMVAAIVVCIAAWEPFDVGLDVAGIGGKVRSLYRDSLRFSVLKDEGMAFLHYGLFAAALATWFRSMRTPGPAFLAAGIGAAIALGLEASQAIVGSRMPSLQDAAIRVAATAIGAIGWTMWRRSPRHAGWLVVVITATAVAAAMDALSPFDVAPEHRRFSWLPFVSHFRSSWFRALSEAIEMTLVYFPLGFCMGLCGFRAERTVVMTVLVLAVPIEYLQGWIVGRVPGVSDVGLAALGGWLGAKIARQGATAFVNWTVRAQETASSGRRAPVPHEAST